MKGVMMPEVSAGSNHVGAIEMWAPQIISPAGASAGAAAPGVGPRIKSARTNGDAKRPRSCLTEASCPVVRWVLLFSFQSDVLIGRGDGLAVVEPGPPTQYELVDEAVLREAPRLGQARRHRVARHRLHQGVPATLTWQSPA